MAGDGYIFSVFFTVEFLVFLNDLFFLGVDGNQSFVLCKQFLQHGRLVCEDIPLSCKIQSIVRDGQVLGGIPLDDLIQVVGSDA